MDDSKYVSRKSGHYPNHNNIIRVVSPLSDDYFDLNMIIHSIPKRNWEKDKWDVHAWMFIAHIYMYTYAQSKIAEG